MGAIAPREQLTQPDPRQRRTAALSEGFYFAALVNPETRTAIFSSFTWGHLVCTSRARAASHHLRPLSSCRPLSFGRRLAPGSRLAASGRGYPRLRPPGPFHRAIVTHPPFLIMSPRSYTLT